MAGPLLFLCISNTDALTACRTDHMLCRRREPLGTQPRAADHMTPGSISAGDTAWVLVSSALVLLMVPALALFYAGLVRQRGALNTVMMSVVALAVVSVQWILVGYSLAFGAGSAIGGAVWFGLSGVGAAPGPHGRALAHPALAF